MKNFCYRARRIGADFRIEDTESGELVKGGLFFLAKRAAARRKHREAVATLAREVHEAGWPELAEDVRAAVSKDVLLQRLHEIGEGHCEAAQIIAAADDALWR